MFLDDAQQCMKVIDHRQREIIMLLRRPALGPMTPARHFRNRYKPSVIVQHLRKQAAIQLWSYAMLELRLFTLSLEVDSRYPSLTSTSFSYPDLVPDVSSSLLTSPSMDAT